MKNNTANFSLRIDKITLDKLSYIAEYEFRSKNSEIVQLIKRKIAEFEKEHGKIEDDTGQDKKCQPH